MDEPATSNSIKDDDEVIKEIPIFNSKRLQESLYLLQYPLLSNKSLNELHLKCGSFKPNNQELKLEMSIDVESSNFDSDRAQMKANSANKAHEVRKSTNKAIFENDMIDKVFLKSSQAVKQPSNYAALMYTGKEIHLATFRNILQLRPDFSYRDMIKQGKDTDHNDVSDEEEAGPSTAELVTVKFKHSDERWKKSKDSFKTLQNKSNEEAWISCNVHTETSSLSKVEKLKLLAENIEPTGQATTLTDSEYLKVLVPEDEESESVSEKT